MTNFETMEVMEECAKRSNDGYFEFEAILAKNFEEITKTHKVLYKVKVDDLWNIYLNNLPEEGRQHYNCNACRHFIERYGNLVIIDNDFGGIKSALWDIQVPPFFMKSVRAMNRYVKSAYKITGIFVSDADQLGIPETGCWTHLSVRLPKDMMNKHYRTKNAEQIMAEKKEDFRILLNAIEEYPLSIVEQAVALLQTDTMYRSDRVLGVAEWFKNVLIDISKVTGSSRTNLIWKAVGEAPAGFCHIKSSLIGTLLDDIKDGYSTRLIIARFEEKMNPQNYMRSQAAPTASAIDQAERLVTKLGIADSLRRRYAKFDDVIDHMLWMPSKDVIDISAKKSGGVFSNITPKEKVGAKENKLTMPNTTMTWAKFNRTILPTADKIEVQVDNPNRFMALVTAAVEGSENILQWNNPFSWYYHGGIDGEIKRRVENAGGTYENCKIRCSLIWESVTDLDLHCYTPNGSHISWQNRRITIDGGMLDVDANGCDVHTNTPVENIRWINNAPNGRYKFMVHNYSDRNKNNNPYKVELEVNGTTYTHEGILYGSNDRCMVFDFNYRNGVISDMYTNNVTPNKSSQSWNIDNNSMVEVTGIVNSPNMWDGGSTTNGNHIFFLLKDCKDTSAGRGRGFFNEMLIPELKEIRKTLEVYTANTPIENVDESDACGVGYSADTDWNLTVRVTSGNTVRLIKIDRFD